MNTMVEIVDLSAGDVGIETIDFLGNIYPSGRRNRIFSCRLPKDAPILNEILDYLEKQGLHAWESPFQKSAMMSFGFDGTASMTKMIMRRLNTWYWYPRNISPACTRNGPVPSLYMKDTLKQN